MSKISIIVSYQIQKFLRKQKSIRNFNKVNQNHSDDNDKEQEKSNQKKTTKDYSHLGRNRRLRISKIILKYHTEEVLKYYSRKYI